MVQNKISPNKQIKISVVPLPNGLFMAFKWGLPTYDTWDHPRKVLMMWTHREKNRAIIRFFPTKKLLRFLQGFFRFRHFGLKFLHLADLFESLIFFLCRGIRRGDFTLGEGQVGGDSMMAHRDS